jgi:hypothetical protein
MMASVMYNYASYTPTTVTVIDALASADACGGGIVERYWACGFQRIG